MSEKVGVRVQMGLMSNMFHITNEIFFLALVLEL